MRQGHTPTAIAAPRTIRQRTHSLGNVHLAVSASDSTAQFAHELLGQQREREKLLGEMKAGGALLVSVPVQSSLAMKADLNIPWSKLRLIKR